MEDGKLEVVCFVGYIVGVRDVRTEHDGRTSAEESTALTQSYSPSRKDQSRQEKQSSGYTVHRTSACGSNSGKSWYEGGVLGLLTVYLLYEYVHASLAL